MKQALFTLQLDGLGGLRVIRNENTLGADFNAMDWKLSATGNIKFKDAMEVQQFPLGTSVEVANPYYTDGCATVHVLKDDPLAINLYTKLDGVNANFPCELDVRITLP